MNSGERNSFGLGWYLQYSRHTRYKKYLFL